MPGYRDAAGSDLSSVVGGRLRLPQDFAQSLYPLLVPGDDASRDRRAGARGELRDRNSP